MKKKLVNSAFNNKAFNRAILKADNDLPPEKDNQKAIILYVAMYYGWLVGKHGHNWRKYI